MILINMEMPKNCEECNLESFCSLWIEARKMNGFGKKSIMRHPNCPLSELKHGKWILNKDGSGTCPICKRKQFNCWDLDNWDNFCHFCGADMRGNEDV